jgi:hypothetical protein
VEDAPLLYPAPEPVQRVPFGFNPRHATNKIEIAQDRGPGNAVTEKSYWYARRSPYWHRGQDLTQPLEVR